MDLAAQFSSVPWPIGSSGGNERRFSRDPLPVFSERGPCEQIWHEQGCQLFDVVHPAFPLPTTASSPLQIAFKDGSGEAVMMRHARTMWVSISWQLPEEVPVGPHWRWSCSTPSRWWLIDYCNTVGLPSLGKASSCIITTLLMSHQLTDFSYYCYYGGISSL